MISLGNICQPWVRLFYIEFELELGCRCWWAVTFELGRQINGFCRISYAEEQGLCNSRESVPLSVPSIDSTTVVGGFAAEHRACRRYRSTAAGAVQQVPELRSKCRQCHIDSQRRRLNTDLLRIQRIYSILMLSCLVFHTDLQFRATKCVQIFYYGLAGNLEVSHHSLLLTILSSFE